MLPRPNLRRVWTYSVLQLGQGWTTTRHSRGPVSPLRPPSANGSLQVASQYYPHTSAIVYWEVGEGRSSGLIHMFR